MEEIRSIKVTIEVETNKRSIIKRVSGANLSGAANATARELAYIEESIRNDA